MKKLSLLAVLLFCLILVGCGTPPETETTTSSEPAKISHTCKAAQWTINYDANAGEITFSNGTKKYILADKNVGATAVYNGTNTPESYGNLYQWGNNHGFPSTGKITASSTLATTVTRPYENATFIFGGDWVQTQNNDLWGDTTNTDEARQGPCPSGRHIPTAEEWNGVFEARLLANGGTVAQCSASVGEYTNWDTLDTYSANLTLDNLKSDLKLPLVGWRYWAEGDYAEGNASGVSNEDSDGIYWSSSTDDNVAYSFSVLLDRGVQSQSEAYRTAGYSLRCFKNV